MFYLKMLCTFFKVGLFTVGGGYAMIPLIQEEIISNGWMNETELIDFIAISESTPGPFAINVATFIGNKTSDIFGAAVCTLGVMMPSIIIVLIIAHYYERFKRNKIISTILEGLRPAVVGLIASAAFSIGKTVFINGNASSFIDSLLNINSIKCIIIFIIILLLNKMAKNKLHPILVIIISGLMGIGMFGFFS